MQLERLTKVWAISVFSGVSMLTAECRFVAVLSPCAGAHDDSVLIFRQLSPV